MLISDKPLGAFLSGGIDSSLICCLLAKKLDKKLKTFTIGFENKKFDESIYAKNIASHLNTDHHEHIFNDKDLQAISKAELALLVAKAYLLPTNSFIFFSNSIVLGP